MQHVEIWKHAILEPSSTLRDAVDNLNRVAIKICLIVSAQGTLEGTVSDGDIRRGLLQGLTLDSSIDSVVNRKPLVVPADMHRDLILQLMIANKVQQIPIVDTENHLIGLHIWDEISSPQVRQNIMIIMAGGMGKRLRPETDFCPKPMLQIAGKPMLEHIIDRAKSEGFSQFILATHYLGHMIENYFGDGSQFDVRIDYLREKRPLGTAGALSLIEPTPNLPFVVTNGDVITDIRYGELLDFHGRHNSFATMAVRLHEWRHPFGVVKIDGIKIVGFEEKPVALSHINAGVYALDPKALSHLVRGEHCDMPTLFEKLQLEGRPTIAYPMHELWLDVGRPDDLKIANSRINQQVEEE